MHNSIIPITYVIAALSTQSLTYKQVIQVRTYQECNLELLDGVRRLLQRHAVRRRRVNVHLSGFVLRVHDLAAREWQHHIVNAVGTCAVAVSEHHHTPWQASLEPWPGLAAEIPVGGVTIAAAGDRIPSLTGPQKLGQSPFAKHHSLPAAASP